VATGKRAPRKKKVRGVQRRKNLEEGDVFEGWVVEDWRWGPPTHKVGPLAALHDAKGEYWLGVVDNVAFLAPQRERFRYEIDHDKVRPNVYVTAMIGGEAVGEIETPEHKAAFRSIRLKGDLEDQVRQAITWASRTPNPCVGLHLHADDFQPLLEAMEKQGPKRRTNPRRNAIFGRKKDFSKMTMTERVKIFEKYKKSRKGKQELQIIMEMLVKDPETGKRAFYEALVPLYGEAGAGSILGSLCPAAMPLEPQYVQNPFGFPRKRRQRQRIHQMSREEIEAARQRASGIPQCPPHHVYNGRTRRCEWAHGNPGAPGRMYDDPPEVEEEERETTSVVGVLPRTSSGRYQMSPAMRREFKKFRRQNPGCDEIWVVRTGARDDYDQREEYYSTRSAAVGDVKFTSEHRPKRLYRLTPDGRGDWNEETITESQWREWL
jgi:hypothetical protein